MAQRLHIRVSYLMSLPQLIFILEMRRLEKTKKALEYPGVLKLEYFNL
jgi:hypothetical protein